MCSAHVLVILTLDSALYTMWLDNLSGKICLSKRCLSCFVNQRFVTCIGLTNFIKSHIRKNGCTGFISCTSVVYYHKLQCLSESCCYLVWFLKGSTWIPFNGFFQLSKIITVLCCAWQLCTKIHAHIWAVLEFRLCFLFTFSIVAYFCSMIR